jgi:hypothetical protein
MYTLAARQNYSGRTSTKVYTLATLVIPVKVFLRRHPFLGSFCSSYGTCLRKNGDRAASCGKNGVFIPMVDWSMLRSGSGPTPRLPATHHLPGTHHPRQQAEQDCSMADRLPETSRQWSCPACVRATRALLPNRDHFGWTRFTLHPLRCLMRAHGCAALATNAPHAQYVRSSVLYWMASAMCLGSICGVPSRSATVRETFRMRS